MYCGDETGSFVGDVGSHVSRFGYGGEDSPKYVVPSYVAEYERHIEVDTSTDPDAMEITDNRFVRTIPTSCYNHRLLEAKRLQNPLRTVAAAENLAPQNPITDPAQFLQQGDSIQDWDAYEYLWQSAFDVLNVRDATKHNDGLPMTLREQQEAAAARKRATGTTTSSATNSDTSTTTNAATKGTENATSTISASGMKSTKLKASLEGLGKCVHPLLAVTPGRTYRVDCNSSNSDGATTNSNMSPTAAAAAAHTKELTRITEIMMESLECRALFVAPSPMLAAFSHGRQTAMVVDIGASGTCVTPVVDGLLLKQAQRRSGRGGDWMGNMQWKALLNLNSGSASTAGSGCLLRPRYLLGNRSSSDGNAGGTGLLHRWAMNDLMYEFRSSEHVYTPEWWYDTTVPLMYPPGSSDDASSSSSSSNTKMNVEGGSESGHTKEALAASTAEDETYELPDGTKVDLTTRTGKDLCRIPELLFTDELPFSAGSGGATTATDSSSILSQHPTLSNLPLPKLIHSSLSAVGDVDIRKELAANILLSGGSSGLPNLEKRLSLELTRMISGTYKCKVLASRHKIERTCAAWIGGSVLSSLGSFQQLWLSRAEYEEYGAAVAVQRFP